MHVTDAGFPWVPERAQLAEDPERRRTWMESLPPLVLPATHKLNNRRPLRTLLLPSSLSVSPGHVA